jgi:hypothetical protein
MILLQIELLPINIPEILKYGVIGLGAIMALLAFWLLQGEQKKAHPRKLMLRSIYIFMLFSILLVFLGLFTPGHIAKLIEAYVVPEQSKTKVDSLPKPTYGEYKLIKDISIFDLRGWKPVPEDEINSKYSPANYINYLHIKKTKPIDKIVAHYATGGYDIDLRCITHNYKTFQQTPGSDDHPGEKYYAIEIDVSGVPLNEEFLVLIEATYWNGFNNIITESASTYTDKEIEGLEELSLIVLLPYDKPIKDVLRYKGQHGQMQPFRDAEKYFLDQIKDLFIGA